MTSGIGVAVILIIYANLIKKDIPLSYIFKGKFKAIKQIYLEANYTFYPKAQLLVYGLLSVVIIVVALLFSLPIIQIYWLLIVSWLAYPILLLWQIRFSYHATQFHQLTSFLQHFIAHFQASSKVYLALEESIAITEGPLTTTIQKALDECLIDGDVNRAFGFITKQYPHFILHNIQTWISSAETYGFDQSKEAIALLQDDIDDWIEDTNLYVQQLIIMKNKILILCMISLTIALFNQHMLSSFMDLSIHSMYHTVIFWFLLLVTFTILMAYRMLSESWILKGECMWNKSS